MRKVLSTALVQAVAGSYRRVGPCVPVVCVVLAMAAVLNGAQQQARKPLIRIGTSLDGAGDRPLRDQVRKEIEQLLENRYQVEFPQNRQLVADWSADRVTRNIDTLLADAALDAVLVLGVAGPAYVTSLPALSKPVVAAIIIDPQAQGVPMVVRERVVGGRQGADRVRVSGVANLSYLSLNLNLGREIEAYREVVPFRRLAFLTQKVLEGSHLTEFRSKVTRDFQSRGFETTFLTVEDSIESALAALPEDVEAVLLGGMPHLTDAAFEHLVRGLIDRKLPTFSLVGQRDVRRGVLAGLKRDRNEQRLVRRVALNLFNVLLGQDAAEIPVDFRLDEQLTINMTTARSIGVDPTYRILTEAELVGEQTARWTRRLSLSSVLREAEGVNLDLLVSGRQVAAGLESVKLARSNLLPQAQASGLSTYLDGNRSSNAQTMTSGSVAFSQLIFSESARSGFDIEGHQQTSREEARAQLRLDVLVDAAVSYLEVLRAKTVERIQRNNLKLTRSNLDLAQTRLDLGAGGREEVLRWRNQIAIDRRSVIDAGAGLGQAELAVNRLLNRPLSEGFETVEADLADPQLTLSFQQLGPYIESPGRFDAFRDFMTRYAWDASPELRQLDADIRAAERSLLSAKREFYFPTVSFDAQVRGIKNSGSSFDDFVDQSNLDWMVGVSATLPLFQGGALRARRRQSQIVLDQLELQRQATRLVVGQTVQSALFQAGASFAGISLAGDAVESARENLEIVRDRYSEGQVDIVRLLDAQTQTLSAELEAANAVFAHLIDLMRVQRAAGRFDYFRSATDREAFLEGLAEFYRSKGIEARTP